MSLEEKAKKSIEIKRVLYDPEATHEEQLEAIKEYFVLIGKLTREQANEIEQFWKEVDDDC